ncbi:hypothetical protein [Methylobacterium sp. A54F]
MVFLNLFPAKRPADPVRFDLHEKEMGYGFPPRRVGSHVAMGIKSEHGQRNSASAADSLVSRSAGPPKRGLATQSPRERSDTLKGFRSRLNVKEQADSTASQTEGAKSTLRSVQGRNPSADIWLFI